MKQIISVFVAMICLTLTVACNNATNRKSEDTSDSANVSQETEVGSSGDPTNSANYGYGNNIYYESDEGGMSFVDKMYVNMPEDKNYMFSPLSIKMALMMAANGASGETQSEILEAFRIVDLDTYNEYVKNIINLYSQSDLLKLDVSNSIWINSDTTTQRFSEEYKSNLVDIFNATSDVVTNQNALEKINGWVNEKTAGKISEIITKDDLDFWAMLVNAVYFKGRWEDEFHEGATKKDTFFSKNGIETAIDFMNKTDYILCSEEDGVTIVALPYLTKEDIVDENGKYLGKKTVDGVDVRMYLLMSDSDFAPEEALNNARFTSEYVALSMPKFKIEYASKMEAILKELGIEKAFSKKTADFKNMFDYGNMWIDSVFHKTYIDVNEEGTEAAAVTALSMDGASANIPPEPVEIKFNKPFTFVIKDDANGEILFVGEYAFAN